MLMLMSNVLCFRCGVCDGVEWCVIVDGDGVSLDFLFDGSDDIYKYQSPCKYALYLIPGM